MTQIIRVVPYDPVWPRLFEEESPKIKQALEDNCIAIHHIGSTSIPGLAAKPIIDILPVVKDILAVDTCNNRMQDLGYEAKGELGIPFRRYFIKGSQERTHNVHVFEEGNPEIERHLMFRDYLTLHSKEVATYSALKKDLAQKYSSDIHAYSLGKDAFIQEIDTKSGFQGLRIVQALTDREWEAYHRIRKKEIFDPLDVIYNPTHPTITAPNHFHFVIIKSTTIVGVAHVELLDQERAALRSFAIDAPCQSQGLGEKFLALIERWIRHQKRNVIHIHANPRAVPFYQKAGYVMIEFNDKGPHFKDTVDIGKYL